MTGINAETFEIYGDNIDLMLEGRLSEIGSAFGIGLDHTLLVIPAWETEGRYWLLNQGRGAGIRYGFGSALSAVGQCMFARVVALPGRNDRLWYAELRAGDNSRVMKLALTADGNLQVYNSVGVAGNIVASTTTPCIIAGTTHKIQYQCTFHATLGAIEIRVDGNVVLNATGLVLAGTTTQVFHGISDASAGPHGDIYMKAVASYTLIGTYNDDWPLITGVATHYPAADTSVAGWTPYPRQKIEAGILYVPGTLSVLDCGAVADYDLGSADYTLETFVRFVEPVPGSESATILGKWSASTAKRSYRLVKYGPTANEGHLRFEITTDGTLGTLVVVHDLVWEPNVGQWYNIALTRESGVDRIFIDGVQQGLTVADANVYFPTTTLAKFVVGGEMSGVGTTVLAASSIDGMNDEIRITPGVARYNANYTPTAVPYPRSSPADPDFADVVLLCGFDEAIEDESSAAQTLVARGTTARLVPNDGSADYLTVNPTAPLDDRYLAASLVPASGILTLTGLPLNTNTVTLGVKTYTFNTVLGGANSVLIGADEQASLANLTNAINQGPGIGVTYGVGTTINVDAEAAAGPTPEQMTATAIVPGTAGNSIVSTETLASGSWGDTTLNDGANIPGPSEFTITPLSPRVTGVRWIEMIDRSFVVGGDGNVQKAFVVDGNAALGTDNALTPDPTYRGDTFEEDPDTAAGLTPSSINNGRFRVNRTS